MFNFKKIKFIYIYFTCFGVAMPTNSSRNISYGGGDPTNIEHDELDYRISEMMKGIIQVIPVPNMLGFPCWLQRPLETAPLVSTFDDPVMLLIELYLHTLVIEDRSIFFWMPRHASGEG